MSTTNAEGSTNPEPNLTPAETENLKRLEAMTQGGLEPYVDVANALAEIRDRHLYRDSHPSFETYVRERWGLSLLTGDPLSQTTPARTDPLTMPTAEQGGREALRTKPCEALARACEETLSALDDDDRLDLEIRVAIGNRGESAGPEEGHMLDPVEAAELTVDELLPTLRWQLTQATGTIGEVSHQLETRAADLDDGVRAQLRDDVLVLEGELAVVKALLIELHDWDAELKRLLKDDLPPSGADADLAGDG